MRHLYIPIRSAKFKKKKRGRRMIVSSSGKDMACLKHSYTAGGNAKWNRFGGNILAVSYKIKHTLTMGFTKPTARCLSKKNDNVCS